jgi:hypothetical protein
LPSDHKRPLLPPRDIPEQDVNTNHAHRGRWLLLAVLALAGTAAAVIPSLLTRTCWVGSKELRVRVQLADADTMEPLPGVPIVVFNGPWTPLEGRPVAPKADPASAEVQQFTTDAQGTVELSRRFFAAGSDSTFHHSGYVRLAGTWIEIAAPGYSTVLLPLDGQSVHPRQFDDDTPVYATVLLKKPTTASAPEGGQHRMPWTDASQGLPP